MSFKTKFSPNLKDDEDEFGPKNQDKKDAKKDTHIDQPSDSSLKPTDKESRPTIPEDKDDDIFSQIDWSKSNTPERPPDKFDTIDWSKSAFPTREPDKFDTINWKETHVTIANNPNSKEVPKEQLNIKTESPEAKEIKKQDELVDQTRPKTTEQIAELYQRKGGRPYYAGKETKGFKEFKKQFQPKEALTCQESPKPNSSKINSKDLEKYEEKDIGSYDKVSKLSHKFLEYKKYATNEQLPNVFPNRAARITNKFIDWIKDTESDPTKAKEYLNQVKQINQNKDIQEIVKEKIKNTNMSLKAMTREFRRSGLNMSPQSIKNIAMREIYNGNKDEMKNRFPAGTGGFLQENYNLDKNNLLTQNIDKLQSKLVEYHKYAVENNLKTPYANRGAKITNNFINWINKNETNPDIRNKIIKSAKQITKDGEIPQLAMKKTLNSNLSMRAISKSLKKQGIYLSEHAISNYVQDHLFENQKEKIERFPSPSEIVSKNEEQRISDFLKTASRNIKNIKSMREIAEHFGRSRAVIQRIAENTLNKAQLDKIWTANKDIIPDEKINAIRNEVKKYYPKSMRKLEERYGVSQNAIARIAKEENPKQEYERKWPVHEKISEETRQSVVNDIKSSNLKQSEIADKHSITRHSVRRFALEEVYKDNHSELRDRFPKDDYLELGTETHNCIIDEVTKFFNSNYNENFYSEPKIFPDSNKAADGLILNDEKFLQNRLSDPDNKYDICKIIHDLPAESLTNQIDHIKAVQFDFTNDITDENINNKSLKYQHPEIMTYIVGTQWYPYDPVKELPNNKQILYPENIRVINHDLFSELIGLEGKSKEIFDQIISLNNHGNIEALKQIHESEDVQLHDSNKLKEDLMEKNYRINEYFNFNMEENTSKQKKLS